MGRVWGERMGGLRGIGGEIVRDMEEDERMNGASRFWETVPEAGRFFCAIVELKGSRNPEF